MDRLRADCIRCLLDKQLCAYPPDTPENKKIIYMQRVLDILQKAPMTSSAPLLLREITAVQLEMFGETRSYAAINRHFNALMLDCADAVREKIRRSADPLLSALHYALAGNYIDFGAMPEVEEAELLRLLDQETPLDEAQYRRFLRDLGGEKTLLYLTDNCGELVMDMLLIETLKKLYPHLRIQVMVRGGEVLNDATRADAEQVGLDRLVPVLDSGSAIAGTSLEDLGPEAQQAWQGADIVLAKGQGNFETLRGCGGNVYYLFLCKCEMFARAFSVPRLTGILVHDSSCQTNGYR